MKTPTLKALSVPSQDAPGKNDVHLYDGHRLVARWPWWLSGIPTRRNKHVVINCYRWRLAWLPDEAPMAGRHPYAKGTKAHCMRLAQELERTQGITSWTVAPLDAAKGIHGLFI